MLLQATDRGLYCAAADLYIDPWAPVPRAVVTHAHADHLQPGCGSYLVARDGLLVTRARLGAEAPIQTAAYGEALTRNGVEVSLHPAGHILGSAQVRLAYRLGDRQDEQCTRLQEGGHLAPAEGGSRSGPDPWCRRHAAGATPQRPA
jgi:hypothetical protein